MSAARRSLLFAFAAVVALGAGCAEHPADVVRLGTGGPPMIAGCPVFPADSAWNQEVATAPVDPRSADYIASIGASIPLSGDFGATAASGIPYNVVPGSQPRVPVTFEYAAESDPGPYPIPPTLVVEGGGGVPTIGGHTVIVDGDNCMLYELYDLQGTPGGPWQAGAGAIWNLRENTMRPLNWTSAAGSGLPIFPGLVRYEEVATGEIRHALRFSAASTQRAFVAPATHYASDATDPALPPMGLRVRLKASVDLRRFPGSVRVILIALQRYGMLLSDNGSSWLLSGSPDPRFRDDELAALRTLHGADFEVVASGPITP